MNEGVTMSSLMNALGIDRLSEAEQVQLAERFWTISTLTGIHRL
jgi:hypothetical protein